MTGCNGILSMEFFWFKTSEKMFTRIQTGLHMMLVHDFKAPSWLKPRFLELD